jgi:energy-coupling factor transporter ATP-binding protein EcfA2
MTTYIHDIDYEQLFGSDSGEDEKPDALRSYFVDIPEFKKFYDPENSLVIVRGRKGMGKSALLKRLSILLSDANGTKDIVIEATGNELMGMGDFGGTDHAYLENHWKQVICKRICVEIGKRINFALTDNTMSMVEAAEIEGFKGANVVSALTERIGGILQRLIPGADSDDPASGNAINILKKGVINPVHSVRNFQETKDRTVWFLIDDIDAKYVDDEQNQHRVGAFFSAIRSLAYSVKGLRIRTSVRTDVWRNLRHMEDQDKIRQYVIDINWKDTTLHSIFAKRILSYLQREKFPPALNWDPSVHYDEIVGQVFDGKLPWDKSRVEPFIPIKILAGNRPRWMGQLCKLAGSHAAPSRIGIKDISHAMNEFGQEKISDILKEHSHQFSDLSKVIDAFRSGKREYNRYQIIKLLQNNYAKKLPGAVPPINGYPYLEADQIAEFLFQIDFVSSHHPGKSDFISYQNDPDAFRSIENQQNKLMWTINASYRNFLRIV